jgi:hypothetical protein
MKKFTLFVLLASVAMLPDQASAQQPTGEDQAAERAAASSPEIWLYQEQMRRYDDPHTAVRRNAEARAEQRRNRIAAMKWFGLSNARPVANPTPWGSMYSPSWISNSSRPFGWSGSSRTAILQPIIVDRQLR